MSDFNTCERCGTYGRGACTCRRAPLPGPSFPERHPTLTAFLFLAAVVLCMALAGGADRAHP